MDQKVSEQLEFPDEFRRDGFSLPIRIFSSEQCKLVRCYLEQIVNLECLVWNKGLGATDRFIFNLAAHPTIVAKLSALLGPDIVLWGASQVVRRPGQPHPWHTDIESSAPDGGFVSVWIGIENTHKNTGMKFVPGSHLFGRTVQELASQLGVERDDRSDQFVLDMAHRFDAGACTVQPVVKDGEAIFFDGRVWHGSHHSAKTGARTALLFQYAAADKKACCIDHANVEWPFQLRRARPPCILIAGASEKRNINLLVPPPSISGRIATLSSLTHQFHVDHQPTADRSWTMFHAFGAATPIHDRITCHASVLAPGHAPHAPHAHMEEELLVVISGEVEICLPDGESDCDPRTERLRPGDFAYYPAYRWHTLRNVAQSPACYVMFKWRGTMAHAGAPLQTQVVHPEVEREPKRDFDVDVLFEGTTCFLDRLQAHLTKLRQGCGYGLHRDEYDVAIVVLEGRIALLGGELARGGIAYCVAGEEHGMQNCGEGPARYLVFEFQKSNLVDLSPSQQTKMPLSLKLRALAKRMHRRLIREPRG
jgi:quercetin dioxygenase-like cupin family protein